MKLYFLSMFAIKYKKSKIKAVLFSVQLRKVHWDKQQNFGVNTIQRMRNRFHK